MLLIKRWIFETKEINIHCFLNTFFHKLSLSLAEKVLIDLLTISEALSHQRFPGFSSCWQFQLWNLHTLLGVPHKLCQPYYPDPHWAGFGLYCFTNLAYDYPSPNQHPHGHTHTHLARVFKPNEYNI